MTRTALTIWFLLAVLRASAETPIPEDGGNFWDFRGKPNFTNPEYEKLYSCKTYEELRDQLVKAIVSIAPADGQEWEDASQANIVANCQLALIRTHYILREFDEADRLLWKLHPANSSGGNQSGEGN
jgi:hypothetical protein